MRVEGLLFAALGILVIAPPQLDADDKALAKRAKALWERYQAECKNLRDGQDVREKTRRQAIAAEFGDIKTRKAADYALQILKKDSDLGVRLVAMGSVVRVGEPKALKKLLSYASRQTRTVLPDIVWEALATSTDPAVAEWLAKEALPRASPRLRLSLVQALGALKAEAARAPLFPIYEKYVNKPRDVVLVYEVVRAFGQIGGPKAEPVLLSASGHADWRVRAAAADVLVPKPDSAPEVIAAVRRLLADPNALVAQRAARNVGVGKARALVPDLLPHLKSELLKTRKIARDALQGISGRDLGFDVSAWRKWWKAEGGSGVGDADTEKPHGPMTVATYHGIKVFSNRVVFVVDVSGSMQFPTAGPGRMEVARKELVRVTRTLTPHTSFNILAFSDDVRLWKRREVVATAANVSSANRWIEEELRPNGMTNTHGALLGALDCSRDVDTIYFLSDGLPSVGTHTDGAVIVNRFAAANRFRGVTVNTISLLLNDEVREKDRLSPEGVERVESFLRALAARTAGVSRTVNKYPPGSKR